MHQAEDIFQRMITRNCGRVVHQLDEMLTDWRLVGHDRERVVNMYREARARRDAMRAPVDGPQSDDRAAYYQSQPQGVGEPPMPNSQTYAYAKSLYSNKPVAQIPKEDGILEGGEMVLPHDFYSGKSQFYDKVALCPECFHSFMVGDADKELACTACAFEFDRMPTDDFSKLKAIMNEHVTSGLAGVAGSFMGAVDQHYSTASQSPNLSAGMSLGMQQQEADFRQTIQQHNQANPNMEPVAGTFTPRVIDEIMLQNFPTVIHNNPGEWRAGAITLAAAPPGTPMTVSPSQFEVEYSYDVAFEPGTLAQPVTEADLDAALADLTRPDETSPSHPNNWNGA